jgi:hypothetical protein
LVATAPDGRKTVSLAEFADDDLAVRQACELVSPELPVVSVARDEEDGATLLGAWELDNGEPAWWSEL